VQLSPKDHRKDRKEKRTRSQTTFMDFRNIRNCDIPDAATLLSVQKRARFVSCDKHIYTYTLHWAYGTIRRRMRVFIHCIRFLIINEDHYRHISPAKSEKRKDLYHSRIYEFRIDRGIDSLVGAKEKKDRAVCVEEEYGRKFLRASANNVNIIPRENTELHITLKN